MLDETTKNSIHFWVANMNRYQNLNIFQKISTAKKILKLQYKVIGVGYNRIVYDLDNGFVLKVTISNKGIYDNNNENQIYKQVPEYLRQHLCPVREFGNIWIVMKKVSSKVPENQLYNRKLAELKEKFVRAGINPKDMKRTNLALSKEGEIIVIDYGNFKKMR